MPRPRRAATVQAAAAVPAGVNRDFKFKEGQHIFAAKCSAALVKIKKIEGTAKWTEATDDLAAEPVSCVAASTPMRSFSRRAHQVLIVHVTDLNGRTSSLDNTYIYSDAVWARWPAAAEYYLGSPDPGETRGADMHSWSWIRGMPVYKQATARASLLER